MHSANLFQKKKFLYLENVVSSDLVSTISNYALLKEAYSFTPDTAQVINAHAVYSDFLMESLLIQYKPIVEEATGLSLLPTYSFYRVYRRGQELVPHTDRPSCEISMSVCYNFDYQGKDYDWPLYMEDNPLVMKPGDAAVYRGMDVVHYRPVFDVPQGSYHVQAFYHYVDANGVYPKYAYDGNKNSHLKIIENK